MKRSEMPCRIPLEILLEVFIKVECGGQNAKAQLFAF